MTWTSILPVPKNVIDESAFARQPVQVVPYGEWLSALRAKSVEAEQDANIDYATLVRNIPGLKLIDFYEGLQDGAARGLNLKLSMQKPSALSPALIRLEPLQGRWIAGWVKGWLEAAET